MKKGFFGFILILIIGCNQSSNKGKIVSIEYPKPQIDSVAFKFENESKYLKPRVITETIGGELEGQRVLKLIFMNENELIDTISLTKCWNINLKDPFYYWTTKTKLLFEDCLEQKIKIINTTNGKIEFEKDGFLSISNARILTDQIDQTNNLIFCFSSLPGVRNKYEIYSLNYKTLNYKILDSIITSGEPLTGSPMIKGFDKNNRILNVEFQNLDLKNEKIEVNY